MQHDQNGRNICDMQDISGLKLKRKIKASGFTKEQVVAHVQYKGLAFSLAGLDRMYRGEFTHEDLEEIVEAIAEKIGCPTSEFADPEARTA